HTTSGRGCLEPLPTRRTPRRWGMSSAGTAEPSTSRRAPPPPGAACRGDGRSPGRVPKRRAARVSPPPPPPNRPWIRPARPDGAAAPPPGGRHWPMASRSYGHAPGDVEERFESRLVAPGQSVFGAEAVEVPANRGDGPDAVASAEPDQNAALVGI